MIIIDQGKIDAPDFPRSLEWWRRFVPEWGHVAVTEDGGASLVTITVTGEAHPSQGRKRFSDVYRRQELCMLRWLHGLPQLEPAIVEDASQPCKCWRYPVHIHDGHCCFTGPRVRVCHRMPADMRATTPQSICLT